MRRLLRLVLRSVLSLVLASVLATLALRWIRPVITSVMIQAKVTAWLAGRPGELRHRWVSLANVSPHAVVAVVAAEDQKFVEHRGFDMDSIASALEEHERGERLRGASTISQQVAKNLFLWSGRSFVRKGIEAWFTTLIELFWTKRRIVEVYLNVAEFGDLTFGVEAASQRYFGKPAARLTAAEAALLAAVLPNPHRLRVERPSAYVRSRQAWIQRQMDQLGGVSYVKQL